ncbi:MAG: hypothetical protein H5T97_10140, partial [Firmicutes bacterium]|nr:hypothetical protein [Bacillota bacterium]
NLIVRNKKHETIGPGNYWYSSISVGNDAGLSIRGPAEIHVTGDAAFDNIAALNVSGPATFYVHGGISLRNNARMSFSAPAQFFVGGNVTFDNNSVLTAEAEVRFTIGGDLEIVNNARLNWSQNGPQPAARLLFLLTTDGPHTVTLSNNANVAAGIYAPDAAVALSNNAYLKGAVVGSTVDLDNKAEVTYDPSLEDVGVPGGTQGRWEAVAGSWSAR